MDWDKIAEAVSRARNATNAKAALSTMRPDRVAVTANITFGHGTPESVAALNAVLAVDAEALVAKAIRNCENEINSACEELFHFLETGK